jgi:hypothetical protein
VQCDISPSIISVESVAPIIKIEEKSKQEMRKNEAANRAALQKMEAVRFLETSVNFY